MFIFENSGVLCLKLVLLLKQSVHYISETEQIKIKIIFIIILMAETVAYVIEVIICYAACVEEKRNTCRILVEKCEGMR
jgi:hypothetical protein